MRGRGQPARASTRSATCRSHSVLKARPLCSVSADNTTLRRESLRYATLGSDGHPLAVRSTRIADLGHLPAWPEGSGANPEYENNK
jgi:hypothetical protein